MSELLFYLCLAKEIAVLFAKIVTMMCAAILMLVGLFTCLKGGKNE